VPHKRVVIPMRMPETDCTCGHEAALHDERGCLAWNPPAAGSKNPTRCTCSLTREQIEEVGDDSLAG
jgi:hypothetical protein